MSWQRIFELARRQKAPLIVTDIAGREPVVVLPFAQYEQLLETVRPLTQPRHVSIPVASHPVDSAPPQLRQVEEEEGVRLEQLIEPITTALPGSDMVPRAVPTNDIVTTEMGRDDQLLEENFYFEPVEEGQK